MASQERPNVLDDSIIIVSQDGVLATSRQSRTFRSRHRKPIVDRQEQHDAILDSTIVIDSDEDLPKLVMEGSSKNKEVDSTDEGHTIISCPICFDGLKEIKRSNRKMVSTICGHLFCDKCLINSVASVNRCPTCRKKYKKTIFHPIYI